MSDSAWIGVKMSKYNFARLYHYASGIGKHPADLVGEWILDRLEDALADEQLKDVTDADQMFLINQRHIDRVEMLTQLRRLAYTALKSRAEEDQELFEQACEVMKVDPDEVLREVGYYREMPPSTAEETGVSAAMNWLASFVPVGNECPVNNIYSEGNDVGFNQGTLKSAKYKLGMVSERRPNEWVWTWPQSVKDVQ